ncbi:MAG: hypothetical protein MUO26_03765 [Methanotrichaceae archaeon]|nr:hypothetical protein [Methanotrichaceae archaeon]
MSTRKSSAPYKNLSKDVRELIARVDTILQAETDSSIKSQLRSPLHSIESALKAIVNNIDSLTEKKLQSLITKARSALEESLEISRDILIDEPPGYKPSDIKQKREELNERLNRIQDDHLMSVFEFSSNDPVEKYILESRWGREYLKNHGFSQMQVNSHYMYLSEKSAGEVSAGLIVQNYDSLDNSIGIIENLAKEVLKYRDYSLPHNF